MSRRFLYRWHRIPVLAGLALISLAGCEGFFGNNGSSKVKIAPEKFHHIEALELQEAPEQTKDAVVDVNEVPAEELCLLWSNAGR